jgi:hypothetical protein
LQAVWIYMSASSDYRTTTISTRTTISWTPFRITPSRSYYVMSTALLCSVGSLRMTLGNSLCVSTAVEHVPYHVSDATRPFPLVQRVPRKLSQSGTLWWLHLSRHLIPITSSPLGKYHTVSL